MFSTFCHSFQSFRLWLTGRATLLSHRHMSRCFLVPSLVYPQMSSTAFTKASLIFVPRVICYFPHFSILLLFLREQLLKLLPTEAFFNFHILRLSGALWGLGYLVNIFMSQSKGLCWDKHSSFQITLVFLTICKSFNLIRMKSICDSDVPDLYVITYCQVCWNQRC